MVCIFATAAAAVAPTATAQMFPQSVASGDPRPDSVVLWTRLDNPDMPDALRVEVAADEDFTNIVAERDLVAMQQYDFAVKVLVDGLMPYTTYYYRFIYGSGGVMETSPVGRTKTAPSADMQVPIRFAVAYGQDYIGRYYNTYLKLLTDHDEDIDFVVHLGDYIYETTGDPSFQDPNSTRTVEFEDIDGAIQLGDPADPYYAAASLSNYRTIYRTYRSDPVLQQLHERWPMVVIWDDHEFSNDHWLANGTYTIDRQEEYDDDRKPNAEQAIFEWIPTEIGIGDDGTLEIGANILYPNTRIYRDFMFGGLLHLVLTDYRSYRPDHLVPEGAFPGTIAVDQAAVIDVIGEDAFMALRENFDPYVNMDVLGSVFPILKQTASLVAAGAYQLENPALGTSEAVRIAQSALTGNISATFINELYAAAGYDPPFTEGILDLLPRGISYLFCGKTAMYSSAGSRTQVIWDSYNLLAAHRYLTTAGAAQEALGGQQTAWLQGTMLQSPATWKVLVSSVMMTPLLVDFTNPLIAAFLPDDFPDFLRTRLGITVDQWDGFPQKKLEILGLLGVVPNAVAISGDIHSAFVTDHTNGVFEFTPSSIASASIGEEVLRRIEEDPTLGSVPGLAELVQALGTLLQISTLDDSVTTSDIVYTNTNTNGLLIVEAGTEALDVTVYGLPIEAVSTSYYDDPDALEDLLQTASFTVQDGELIPGK